MLGSQVFLALLRAQEPREFYEAPSADEAAVEGITTGGGSTHVPEASGHMFHLLLEEGAGAEQGDNFMTAYCVGFGFWH